MKLLPSTVAKDESLLLGGILPDAFLRSDIIFFIVVSMWVLNLESLISLAAWTVNKTPTAINYYVVFVTKVMWYKDIKKITTSITTSIGNPAIWASVKKPTCQKDNYNQCVDLSK